jgi:hypothetical protein
MELFSVKIDDNVPDIHREIIAKYWEWNSNSFIYDINNLRLSYNLKRQELIDIYEQSEAISDFGKCCGCACQIIVYSRNRTQLRNRNLNWENRFFCLDCRTKINKHTKDLEPIERKRTLMRHAFEYKIWQKLTYDELNVLKAIARFSTWGEIFQKVISPNYKYAYPIFDNLDRVHLLYIERNIYSSRITNVYFHLKLREAILT